MVIALPITVIGSNFATIYKKMVIDEKISEEEAAGDLDDEEDDDNEDGDDGVGPGRCCLPHHPPQFRPVLPELNGSTRRGEQHQPDPTTRRRMATGRSATCGGSKQRCELEPGCPLAQQKNSEPGTVSSVNI